MKSLKHLVTKKDLLLAGATIIEPSEGLEIYEIGNQKYIVKEGVVIHAYTLDDSALKKYDDQERIRELNHVGRIGDD